MSLKATKQGLEIVEDARKRKRWKRQDAAWYTTAAVSLATLRRFLAGEPVGEESFKVICKAVGIDNWQEIADLEVQETESPVSSSSTDPSVLDPNFVGRENAIAYLNTLVNQGAKVIVIQSPGGVGKTTLAKKYLREKFGEEVLEFPIAKETKDIASVESLIEERLRQLGEEPGREFLVSLERLKQKLKTQPMGVLIDNLEPALDESGRLVEEHRRYVELLRVLACPTVKSLTLITSREPLCECVDSVHYSLPSLSEEAWQEFFINRGISTDTHALAEMHQAFGGNALAMKILCDPIQRYFDGDVAAYWQEHKSEDGLLAELAVENLIKEQFNRLQQIYPEAYRLLYRLGCYRYQDVPRVPIEGLFCLLWDVPEAQQRRVIQSLRDRSLVEFCNGEYWLHPVIRAEAIGKLRGSKQWETANRKAGEFWTESVKTVETLEDALKALEAYYHYVKINDFELAGSVITQERDNKWEEGEALGRSFFRLGSLHQIIFLITRIIHNFSPGYSLISLYNILGSLYWLTGQVHEAIKFHTQSCEIARRFDVKDYVIYSLINIGVGKSDLWEIEEAVSIFREVEVLLRTEGTENLQEYEITPWYCLAFLNSCLQDHDNALKFAEKAYNKLSIFNKHQSIWGKSYGLLFLGNTYKNIGAINKAYDMYREAISYAEETHYTQVKAKAITGLAALYREQGDFE